jgi:hypothetical protein
MMFLLWQRISYLCELLVACLIFMQPMRKRNAYPLRAAGLSLVLLVLSYLLNCVVSIPDLGLLSFPYWGLFLVVCVPFVRFCTDEGIASTIYCVVCASAVQHIASSFIMIWEALSGIQTMWNTLILIALYLLADRLLPRRLSTNGRYPTQKGDLIPLSTIILFVCLLTILQGLEETSLTQQVIYHLSDALCCCYVLWGQVRQMEKVNLQRELDGIQSVLIQQQTQFQITQETIDMVNQKCHDLRHQIRSLRQIEDHGQRDRYLQEIEDAVMIYDTALKTGNTALDTVLMEKGLFCQSHGIQLTCMADGAKLNQMEPGDIYALFGNAIDNAVTAVMALEDADKRAISIKILSQAQLVMIQIQNYYAGTLRFEDGLPQTQQTDHRLHGYGMKSMRYTAEKYHGTMTVQAKDQIFCLQVLIPQMIS